MEQTEGMMLKGLGIPVLPVDFPRWRRDVHGKSVIYVFGKMMDRMIMMLIKYTEAPIMNTHSHSTGLNGMFILKNYRKNKMMLGAYLKS
ncbi:hypothetical protein D770_04860 [Flammeovirgaceae bacterium 311]|nr:hypothetical protein D770_04860 [Flammeovirgaceae bacterium 311]